MMGVAPTQPRVRKLAARAIPNVVVPDTGRGLVGALQDAYGGQQQQQGRVRQHAAVVARGGFAAEGQGQRLGFRAAAQQVSAVPDAHRGDAEPQQVRQASGGDVAHEGAKQPDAGRAHPGDQRAFFGVRQQSHLRQQPGDAAFADRRDHGRQSDRIVRFPRVAHEQAGHDIGQRQAQQNQSGELCGGHGREPGRSGKRKWGHGR
ncbi:hypothetical protein G6F68_013658 [Rhizopus microsporus]|nr:hypothetical protein G6F68_013658 [Rhizopus microsporus]